MEAWIIPLGAAALLVRIGMAVFHTGLSRSKNAASTMLRSVCDLAVAALAFWAIGAAILQQNPSLLFGATNLEAVGFFNLTLMLIPTGIVVGALSERSRFAAIWPASAILAGVIVPLAGRWAWNGWLRRLGFVDVGGASVIHLSGAMCAIAGVVLLGARTGKYNTDRSANMIPGHHMTIAAIGTLLMFVGWSPYVIGAAFIHDRGMTPASAPAVNVIMSAAAGAISSLIFGRFRFGKLDALLTYGGMLGGLVAISAGAASVSSGSAVLIGAVAGIVVPVATLVIDLTLRIDDVGGGISIHGCAGIWGTLAAALFMPVGIGERLKLLGVQALGIVCIGALALALSLVLFFVLRATIGLRSTEDDEYNGLDLAEHDVNAYPDFQQTMIKSYHLREM